MSLLSTIKSKLSDPLFTFKVFERFIAAFCVLIPLILWLNDGGINHPFRSSISQYVYMAHSYVFGMLLSIAAMLFIFNGAVYFKNVNLLNISVHGQWYNVVLGLSLIGVICFPCDQYPIPHYTFAIIFFVGNALVTGIFYKDQYKVFSIILAVLTVIALPFALLGYISILAGEWISLTVIAIHFILNTINMDKPVNAS
ncbi:MAG: DUF998 domain-containing protein [Bacteroidales bacterium]|nr:DUF998 domain-containing protein [Bacteroidales bacterium]